MSKQLVVRTPTQAIYDAVVAQAVAEGMEPLKTNRWPKYHENTCVVVSGYLQYGPEDYYQEYLDYYQLIDAKDYLKERTMENLQAGDILVNNGETYDLEVQGVIGKAILTTKTTGNNFGEIYSVKELEDEGWKLKDSEPKVTEVTLTEISERFNIPLEKLRIKE